MSLELGESSAEDAGFHPEQIERIRQRGAEWIDNDHTQSLVLLAARRGRIGLYQAFGDQSFDDNSPLDRESIFNVASVSKIVTATAIMMLVEDGALSLNRPVKDYVPELTGKYTERMLMHQLMTHTSGFADVRNPPVSFAPDDTDVPCPEGQYPFIHRVMQTVAHMDCHKKPGEQNMYCNENFAILGEIVRRVTGKDLEEFCREQIFAPLGMNSSTFRSSEPFAVRKSRRDPSTWPYDVDFDEFQDTPMGAASLKMSALDLAVFGQTFLNGGVYGGQRILNDWSVSEMTRNQIPGVGTVSTMGSWIPEASWGLGWMVQGDAYWPWSHGTLQPRGTYYHQGASGCSLWVDPVHDVIGVYLSVVEREFPNPDPMWEFDKFQNMVTAAVDHDH